MFEFMSDTTIQFIVIAFLTIIGLGIPVYTYLQQKIEKKVSYEVLSMTSLFSTKEELSGRLQVFFDGKNVKNIRLAIIKIINSGSSPIPSTDYETPISISFKNVNEILSAEVTDTNPPTIDEPIEILSPSEFKLQPILLNSGDFIILKVIFTYDDPTIRPEINVKGRIIGVKSIRELEEPIYPVMMMSAGICLTIVGLILTPFSVSFVFIFGVGYIPLILGAMSSKRMRKRMFGRFLS